MKRAAQAFDVDESGTDSTLVEKVWSARGATESQFQSVAETHWQFVVIAQRGTTSVFLQGPTSHARVTPTPQDAEFFGVVMRLGSFLPTAPPSHLGVRPLPVESGGAFWFEGDRWEIPTAENADVMVERMRRRGLVAEDRGIARALGDQDADVSLRTQQRRVRRATGLTHSLLRQIERAYEAADALGRGDTIADVTQALGFSDQPHLTRSLRRFIGLTPAQLCNAGAHWTASTPLGSLRARAR